MIYRKIWDKSGAKDLPFPLCLVHFDTEHMAQHRITNNQTSITN